jgi:hypothetical protein
MERPLATIAALDLPVRTERKQAALDAVAGELRDALGGRTMPVSWVHGDFSPENIVMSPTGDQVVGILDWERARPNDVPWLDALHLVLTTRSVLTRRDLGDTVCRLRARAAWTADERAALEIAPELVPETLDGRAMLLFCWLRHVESNLTKCTRFGNHRVWLRHNVVGVLEAMVP